MHRMKCRARDAGQDRQGHKRAHRRPSSALLTLLISYCCLAYVTGAVNGANQPTLCERNICKNSGKCYLMETSIPYEWPPPSPPTVSPTTPAPTTPEPTTSTWPEPTSSVEPTTPEPTTSEWPTTPGPTSTWPTTPEPTSPGPTTLYTTTPEPTTPEPTTQGPTTLYTTTPGPTTPGPTTPEPSTTPEQTTPGPTTPEPTSTVPTTTEPPATTGGTDDPFGSSTTFSVRRFRRGSRLRARRRPSWMSASSPATHAESGAVIPVYRGVTGPKLWELDTARDDYYDYDEADERQGSESDVLMSRARPLRAPPLDLTDQPDNGQSCYCDEDYEGDDCSKAHGADTTEYTLCRDQKITGLNGQIILDFAMLGLLPWDITNYQSGCSPPEQPPDDSDGCLVPSGAAALRYWCQGKTSCTPSMDFLTYLGPDSCTFHADDALSMWLYLRLRADTAGGVTECHHGATYDPGTRTCYVVTDTARTWHEQRAVCRQLGGDMMFDIPSSADFVPFLKNLVAATGVNITEVWAIGTASEARPVANLSAAAYPDDMDFCVPLTVSQCSQDPDRYTVCALPPWPSDVTPDCPAVTFTQYGLTFPETEPGKTVRQPCGVGYTGNATYMCGLDGQWSSQYPDLSGCRSEEINTDDAKTRLENGTEPVSNIVSDLTTNVTKQTSQNKPLTSGDVINSVQLLPQMVSAQQAQLTGQPDQDREIVGQYLNNVTSLVNELTRQEASWHSMPRANRSQTSSTLQMNVEQSAYLLTPYLDDDHRDVNYETIRLRTGRYSSLSADSLRYVTQQGSTVTLPDEVSRFNQSGNTTIVFVEYGNMDCLLQSQECRTADEWHQQEDLVYPDFVNSPMVSASVGNVSAVFESSNVTFRFKTHLSASRFNLSNVKCVFWNDSTSRWSDDGCSVGAVTNDSVDCLCSHLTSFATLMDINGIIQEGSPLDLVMGWLTTIGCIISLISLALCLVVFTAIPSMRRDPSRPYDNRQAQINQRTGIHRNLCLTLFAAEFILLVGLEPHGNPGGCAFVAVLLHFLFLAAFTWMCIEGINTFIQLYLTLSVSGFYMRQFYIWGYGMPAFVVIVTLAATQGEGYGTEIACWLSSEHGVIWAFAGPVLLMLTMNMAALILALFARVTKGRDRRRMQSWLGSASLVVILGITWLFGFLYFDNGTSYFAVVFTILNSLQGFFIFVFLVLLNTETRLKAQRFMWQTTNRLGLTHHDLSQHGPSSPMEKVSSFPDPTQPGASQDDDQGPTKLARAASFVDRIVTRVRANASRYSMKRMHEEGSAPPESTSHETLRRLESNNPAVVGH